MIKLTSIMTGGLVLGVTVLLALGSLEALAQHEQHKHQTMNQGSIDTVTLTGEVLGLYCFMKHPANGQGPDHAKCAQTCIRKGLPIGFLSDGEVYLIIGKGHESAKDLVIDFAGAKSRLTGTLIEHDGVKAIEIQAIEAISG